MKYILTIPFILCGLVSAFLFGRMSNDGHWWQPLFPAALFDVTLLLVTRLSGATLHWRRAGLFVITSLAIYAGLFYITLVSWGFAGIVTGPIGAFAVLRLANKWLAPTLYDEMYVYVMGMASFLIDFLIGFGFPGAVFSYFGSSDAVFPHFALVYLIWQSCIGWAYVHGMYARR